MPLKILYLSSEVQPWSKTGGLSDVAGALPFALAELGHEVTVATPLYASVPGDGLTRLPVSLTLRFPFGAQRVGLYEARPARNVRVLFIDHPGSFNRPELYGEGEGYPDNHRRFAVFSLGALSAAQALELTPDVVHLNDWQTGLAALALRRGYRHTPLGRARSLFSIHNLAYQGVFPKWTMDELGLPWSDFTLDGLEFYDQLSFLKAGLVYADALSTVSPRYAQEIQTPEGGDGLHGLLRRRGRELTGILNGIDAREWDPANDPHLPKPYSAKTVADKAASTEALRARMGLPPGAKGPVFGVVSRLVPQKGIDLLLEALPGLTDAPWQLVALGSGERAVEQGLTAFAAAHPERAAVRIGYDRGLSHLIEAGSDFFLMPSRFEPCGLNQLYSLRYGAVPVVRATGGLADTVVDLSDGDGTGLCFGPPTAAALAGAMRRALALAEDPKLLAAVRRRGMAQDFSWATSAARYVELYRALLARERKAA